MNTNAASDRSAPIEAPPATAEPAVDPALDCGIDPVRLARLFRHTVRVGGVNPLLHLMPRFRKERVS